MSDGARGRRAWGRAAIAALVMLFGGLIGGACGGDGGSTSGVSSEEYFAELGRIDARAKERSDEAERTLSALLSRRGTPTDEAPREVAAAFEDILAIFSDFIDEMDELKPPDLAEKAHDEALDAFRDVEDELDSYISGIRETPVELLNTTIQTTPEELRQANARATEACVQLEELSAQEGTPVDLDCGPQ